MGRKVLLPFSVIVIVLMVIWNTSPFCTTAYGQSVKQFDGRWWQTASSEERRGFLDGYFDCHNAELKGK
ncbi:hypothetical protein GWO13_03235, partial [Candidatus Bathyarchaeota archaeon]|nr:hypothetical protein [Candidatus Bathyarchaeota archaeon]